MVLSSLLKRLVFTVDSRHPWDTIKNTEIKNISTSLAEISEGSAFVAVKGIKFDGHLLCTQAEALGAKLIISECFVDNVNCINIITSNSREALSIMAANLFENPAENITLTGITGTNGKTSTAYMLEHILSVSGFKTGIIGTVENRIGKVSAPSLYTTPEPVILQRLLAKMKAGGIEHTVMEVSSHALEQKRVFGINFEVGVFTNLSVDHMDYHSNFENYKAAKLKLFDISKNCLANKDSAFSEDFLKYKGVKSFSLKDRNADFYAHNIEGLEKSGKNGFDIKYIVSYDGRVFPVRIKIPGIFNIYNSLAAFASACLLGVEPKAAAEALSSFEGVKGRMEEVKTSKPFNIIIDFAHTPDGLLNLLLTVRNFTEKRIILVFGCGGDRDKLKRPMMGRIAEMHSDIAIVSSDNPRSEKPLDIIFDIISDIDKTEKIEIIADRREAIARALSIAKEGDTVLIAGKGHEQYQIIKDKITDMNEKEIILDFLRENNEHI